MNKKKFLMTAVITGLISSNSYMPTSTAQAEENGECHGVNSCKGKGACGGQEHSCAGQNGCKGKGWLKLSKKKCEEEILKAAKEKGMFFKE